MRGLLLVAVLAMAVPALAQAQKAPTLKSILLAQLHSTHDKSEWFVCADVAVAGLTPEQASWTDGKGNHSVGQLVNHLVFWNEQQLAKLTGTKPAKYNGNNDETFNSFDSKSWSEIVKRLDAVLTNLEKLVENADEAQLAKIAPGIAHVNTHNAYHIGQIVYVRKEQGSWDASKGVK
ncbi:MAG: DinB family protein [Candidatus Acidiferrum sp.]